MNIVPIIEIRPGYVFNVMVTQDLVPRSRRRHGAPMRVKPVQSYRAVALKGRIPGELHAAPMDYTTYYRDKTGQTIDVWSLMVQMLERFVETDREFLAWRRRSQNGPGAGPTTS